MKKGTLATLSTVLGAVTGAIATYHITDKPHKEERELREKLGEFYHILIQWLTVKQEGKTLAEYFKTNGYKTVAIYGMKELGERLLDELKSSKVEVKYAIDRDAENLYADVDVLTMEDELPTVDVIVVTAIHYFDDIEEKLSEKVDCPIISLEDVIWEA